MSMDGTVVNLMQGATVEVKVEPTYPVKIAAGLLERVADFVEAQHIALISDTNVAPLYAERVEQSLRTSGKTVQRYVVPPSEPSKSTSMFETLLSKMIRDGFTRKGAVVALGGGVVSDLAGFVAASFMRGIDFIICPTSLLAMVDASVGGKTGINLPEGKNLVGAFWQPKTVLIDVATLQTLPEQEFKGGAVELFKHGLLAEPSILTDMAKGEFRRDGPSDFLVDLIERSVQVKADIVAQDEREGGARAHLNLGHTLAHALEAHSKHHLTHGEAVAYGLLYAAKLAELRGWQGGLEEVRAFLSWVAPKPLPATSLEELKPYIERDKKKLDRVRWVLLEHAPPPRLADDGSDDHLSRAWDYLQETAAQLHST